MTAAIDNIRASLNALKQLVHKNTERDRADMSLIQDIEYQLENLPEACIKVHKDSFDLLIPLNTPKSKFDLLLTFALRRNE